MNEADYFTARAERHRRLAEQAQNPTVRSVHEQIAAAYRLKAAPPR